MANRSKHVARALSALVVVPLAAAFFAPGCSVENPDDEDLHEEGEAAGERSDPVSAGTVENAMNTTCVTSSVRPLSEQIIAEMACIEDGNFVEIPSRPNLHLSGLVFPFLVKKGRDALVAALDANPNKTMTINSAFRTVAQQYLLYRWDQQNRCGIGLAAKPGRSNHETGLALDVQESSSWRSALESRGFDWLGSSDPVHYDYEGSGAIDKRGLDVKAFQRLWNRNNPNDRIGEDGAYGPQTEARLKKSPAGGFPIGATCGNPNPNPDPDPDPDPNPQDCGSFSSAEFTCASDGNGRGRCESDSLDFESCTNGCLINASGADTCMGTAASPWSCSGTTGKTKMTNGNYMATSFGCWVDDNGVSHSDPGDNCIPACLSQIKNMGMCSGMTGPQCERSLNWYSADRDRFGCGAKLRVTNPANGKTAVVVVIDAGPACWVEDKVDTGVLDLSYRVTEHLFGGQVGVEEKRKVHVVEVDPSTPIGPI